MTDTSNTNIQVSEQPAHDPRSFYLTTWRWHFYAALYVVPFLMILAVTGLTMLWISVLSGRDGEWIQIERQAQALPVSELGRAAIAAVPDGELRNYIAPRADNLVALFRVDQGGEATMVAVNPYTADIVTKIPRRGGWYDLANDIHGTLLLGTTGDRLIEIAASLTMVLIATGLYLWWPRDRSVASVLLPDLRARGRAMWRTLHVTTGVWISLFLVVFLISGLSWSGIWGEKLVQAWSTFPAEKFDAPLSEDIHASMNHGSRKEVPWVLEQTQMPLSDTRVVSTARPDGPVSLDEAVAIAVSLGFQNRFQLSFPKGPDGVWTISRDSMSNDSSDPTSDRTVHVDQYTGAALTDVKFADYSVYGQAMAVGIAFHEGDLGIWNIVLNTLVCLSVIILSVSGIVLWWKRRPANTLRLAAPPRPKSIALWRGALLVGLAISMMFPLAGLTLLTVLAADYLVLSRIPPLRRVLS
ncbi:MAG: PepSY domain-containing protein [Roseovarius sp.]|nr:PepSY domain-containing protein [Roseovarius sp.]